MAHNIFCAEFNYSYAGKSREKGSNGIEEVISLNVHPFLI